MNMNDDVIRQTMDEAWEPVVANAKKLADEADEDEMETVQSAKAEVITKPAPDIEKFEDKAVASKMTEEEIKKHIEDNVIDEFND